MRGNRVPASTPRQSSVAARGCGTAPSPHRATAPRAARSQCRCLCPSRRSAALPSRRHSSRRSACPLRTSSEVATRSFQPGVVEIAGRPAVARVDVEDAEPLAIGVAATNTISRNLGNRNTELPNVADMSRTSLPVRRRPAALAARPVPVLTRAVRRPQSSVAPARGRWPSVRVAWTSVLAVRCPRASARATVRPVPRSCNCRSQARPRCRAASARAIRSAADFLYSISPASKSCGSTRYWGASWNGRALSKLQSRRIPGFLVSARDNNSKT